MADQKKTPQWYNDPEFLATLDVWEKSAAGRLAHFCHGYDSKSMFSTPGRDSSRNLVLIVGALIRRIEALEAATKHGAKTPPKPKSQPKKDQLSRKQKKTVVK